MVLRVTCTGRRTQPDGGGAPGRLDALSAVTTLDAVTKWPELAAGNAVSDAAIAARLPALNSWRPTRTFRRPNPELHPDKLITGSDCAPAGP